MSDLKQAIEILAKHYNKSVETPSLAKYKEVVEKNRNNPLTLKYIDEQYRPMTLSVGTFGSYLWGCSQNYYGNVNRGCSALCAGSISHNLEKESEITCQYQIWTYDKELKNETPKIFSSRAYIYVPYDWKYFEKIDIEKLKNIEYATILTTRESKHITLIPMTHITNLPIKEEKESIFSKAKKTNNYFIICIFVLFFLILIFIYFKRKKNIF